MHTLSQRSTEARERARETVGRFLNAPSARRDRLRARHHRGDQPGGVELGTEERRRRRRGADHRPRAPLEHRSLADALRRARGRSCRWRRSTTAARSVSTNTSGSSPAAPASRRSPTSRTALGTINPVREMAAMAHRAGAVVLVDGAQAVPHLTVDVQALGCDFYAFSGHKVYGPSGIGALWGRAELLEAMPPWQGGGGMIRTVTFDEGHLCAAAPSLRGGNAVHRGSHRPRRCAGVPRIASVSAPSAAWESELLALATERLAEVPGLTIIGTAREQGGRPLLQHGGDPPARRRHGPRPRGNRRPRRSPLRSTGDGAVSACRPPRAPPSRSTTRPKRSKPSPPPSTGRGSCSDETSCATSTRRSSSTTTGGPATSASCRKRTARRRGTTRFAATR